MKPTGNRGHAALDEVLGDELTRLPPGNDVDEICDNPAALGVARHAVALDARLAHRLLGVRNERLQVGRGGTRADDEEVRERTLAANVVDLDVLGLRLFERLRDDLCFLFCFHAAHYTINAPREMV